MSVIISGPAGAKNCKTPHEARYQVHAQHEKRERIHKTAIAETLKEYAKVGTTIIKERTKLGFDYRRRKFGPYSASYAKRKGFSVGSVNLTTTGEFLDDIFWASRGAEKSIIAFRSLRMRKRARGLARGNWRIWTNSKSGRRKFLWLSELGARRPPRRIMGFENELDRHNLQRAGWKVFRRVMAGGLRYPMME